MKFRSPGLGDLPEFACLACHRRSAPADWKVISGNIFCPRCEYPHDIVRPWTLRRQMQQALDIQLPTVELRVQS